MLPNMVMQQVGQLALRRGELLLLLLLLPLTGLLGLRLLDIFRAPLRGLGDPEYDDSELPRLGGGPRPLRGEADLE